MRKFPGNASLSSRKHVHLQERFKKKSSVYSLFATLVVRGKKVNKKNLGAGVGVRVKWVHACS